MSMTNQMGQGRGTLSAGAARVEEARSDFDRLDQELLRHLETARSAWSGEGGTAFTALGQAWSERQRTITGALEAFATSLRATESDNTGTDAAQSAMFTRNRQRLG